MKRIVVAAAVVILIAALYVLGHNQWHHPMVTIMNDVTRFVTGSP